MKRISMLLHSIRSIEIAFLVLASIASVKSVDLSYFSRYGGSENKLWIGVMYGTTTLNAALKIYTNTTTLDMAGAQCFVWDLSLQTWSSSSWDTIDQAWLPNLSITAGQAIKVQAPIGPHDVVLSGTYYGSTKTISLLSGWNFFAATWDGDAGSPVTPSDGDIIQAIYDDGEAFDAPHTYFYHSSSNEWTWDQSGMFQDTPNFELGTGAWYYNTGSTKNFTQSYP